MDKRRVGKIIAFNPQESSKNGLPRTMRSLTGFGCGSSRRTQISHRFLMMKLSTRHFASAGSTASSRSTTRCRGCVSLRRDAPKVFGPKETEGMPNGSLKAGKMHEAGLQEVEAARKDGRWKAAYDSAQKMEVPDDFLTELGKNSKAKAFFETLNRANVYAIVWRLQTAQKPETRQKRLKTILAMLAEGQKFHD